MTALIYKGSAWEGEPFMVVVVSDAAGFRVRLIWQRHDAL